jgi:imidazolonepropionase-like amidohydrolase
MKTLIGVLCLSLVGTIALARDSAAQNLVITNARILDGKGGVLERGFVVVRDGKIVSISSGTAPSSADARVIDAQGRTVMPGFIDAHRHIIGGGGDPAQWLQQQAVSRMQEFLEAGFTTVLSAGDSSDQILELRRRTAAGTIKGPRIFAAGRVALSRPAAGGRGTGRAAGAGPAGAPTAPPAFGGRGDPARFDVSRPPLRPTEPAGAIPAEETIKAVESVARAGFDYIKTGITVTPGGPETETLTLVIREGKKHNLPTVTHAVTVIDTLAAVEAGPAVLVHTPHIGRLEEDVSAVQKIAKAGIPMTSTLAIFIPHFGADNQPLFRDRLPFPWDTISSGGQGPINARLLWEAGISYGYGTDTSWTPTETLADELRALALVFSPKDIVSILTKNAAASVIKSNELGTLEPGKVADIVILEGDPLRNTSALLSVVTTIKGGEVLIDKRAQTDTARR